MFIDVLDCVTIAPKLKHPVEGPYRVLGQDQHTVLIQCKELVFRNTADRVVLAPRPTGVPSIPPESASKINIQDSNLEGTQWLLH